LHQKQPVISGYFWLDIFSQVIGANGQFLSAPHSINATMPTRLSDENLTIENQATRTAFGLIALYITAKI